MEKILKKPEEQKNEEQESKEKTLPKEDAYLRAKVIASIYLDDKKTVQQTKEACEPFRIRLFDSIIGGKNRYYSAADKGKI